MEPAQVVVVTGLSGAGKSTALRTLSDLGYYCVDNLPPSLVLETVRVCASGGVLPVALGLDVRVGAFLEEAMAAVDALAAQPWRLEILFLEATDEALVRRFSETRRPHPLLAPRLVPGVGEPGPPCDILTVSDGVRIERGRLAVLRMRAQLLLDTSQMSVHDLRREVIERYGPGRASGPLMLTRFVSFGFKYGLPLDADLLFDVRFLDNPYFVGALRDRPGTDPAVSDFVLASPGCAELLGHVEALLRFALPRYEREGKSYLTVGVGCTGGRHRSVAIAQALAQRLARDHQFRLGVVHRDLARDAVVSLVPPAPTSGGRPGVAPPTQGSG